VCQRWYFHAISLSVCFCGNGIMIPILQLRTLRLQEGGLIPNYTASIIIALWSGDFLQNIFIDLGDT
jgi:hypothetical protein